ncbi:hypothetical protein C7B62_18855 [Pleurocapsa sp. CCALA 161]|uniref:hypothetical protein n=1 Tax=Pleurocapsa sp. CCALA 161 TaxID=2107688 RepID=UPI000D04A376|nr:hypothetical protein [Pleurocapsa sp. CCALA 161]PSB07762.1 hypothetical protein C7B62_18855 [Pleurocapsa sp. CCALA 161]
MSQQSPSTELETTWGKFSLREKAQTAQSKLSEAGIDPQNITLETENFTNPVKLEDTKAIANLKTGAIAGAVLGALIGLSISLIAVDFVGLGLAALKNFQTIHYFAPIMGAIVGAAGISLILGLSGASVTKDNRDSGFESLRYLVVVQGTGEEVALGREIIAQQGGVVEEAERR